MPTVRDRVVQTAIVHVIEPIFERNFAPTSYGFRSQRGAQPALECVEELLKAGYRKVVDADLKSYFDTIPHERLLQRIREKVADGRWWAGSDIASVAIARCSADWTAG